MDRQALKLPFTLQKPNDWVCPTCRNEKLRIKPDTFQKSVIHDYSDHDGWDPEDTEYVFSCMLICKNDQCKEAVSCAGVGSVESNITEYEDDEPTESYEDYFLPKYFEPHLRLIGLPENCPESIATPLNESFRLFFSSPSAASNSVRIAVEELLTALKVRRFTLTEPTIK